MVLLFFGPPGSGKGTQSKRITEWLGIPAISTGELFRAEVAAHTTLGREAQEIMSRGGLIGDDIVNRILEKRISQSDTRNGFLLDGYPRSIPQAQYLDDLLDSNGMPEPTVLHLDVPREIIVARLSGRRTCQYCNAVYNIHFHRPRIAGICDLDGMPLEEREDDRESIVRARMQAYDRVTGPVLGYFRERDYWRIDGDRHPHEVADEIAAAVEHRLVGVRARRA